MQQETQEIDDAKQEAPENASLVLVKQTLTEFDRVAAGLTDLATKYANVVYPVATTKGMEEAKAARAAIREPRYQVEKVAKAAKAPLNALKKNIDERAEQITAALFALEIPIDHQIKIEEARKEEERRIKAEAEAARVAGLRARVDLISAMPTNLAGESSAKIGEALALLNAMSVEGFEEFTPHACDAKEMATSRLIDMQAKAKAHEAEQEAFRRAQEDLARQRAEAAAEAARLAAERAEMEARLAADRAALQKKIEAEAEAAAAERLRLAVEADRAREAEMKKIADFNKTQQDAFEAERLAEQQKLQAARDELASERRAHQEEMDAARRAAEPVVAPAAVAPVAAAPAAERAAVQVEIEAAIQRTRPSAEEIVAILAARFQEENDVIVEWIVAAAEELSGVAA